MDFQTALGWQARFCVVDSVLGFLLIEKLEYELQETQSTEVEAAISLVGVRETFKCLVVGE